MKSAMNKNQQETYDAIFQQPIARHLHRRDVTSMLGVLAVVEEEANGNLKARRNGHSLTMRSPRDKNVTTSDELKMIKNFLERSETPAGEVGDVAGHFLVLIDHREARIYKSELRGTVPEKITPFDPHGYGRHLRYVEEDASGKRKPELKSFYEAIAKTLKAATEILIFGSGTGESSAMVQLVADLKKEHPDLEKRIVGAIAVNAQHLTDDQLLARARDFYNQRGQSAGSK